jgi:hypothetical protein
VPESCLNLMRGTLARLGQVGQCFVAHCIVHNDYECVAVVAAGLATPMAVTHPLVMCQSRSADVSVEDGTHCHDGLAFELIGPVATDTASFHHVVEPMSS